MEGLAKPGSIQEMGVGLALPKKGAKFNGCLELESLPFIKQNVGI